MGRLTSPLVLVLMWQCHVSAALVLHDLSDYTNDFNFLPQIGSTHVWTNDQSVQNQTGSPGWYWQDGTASLSFEAGFPLSHNQFSLGNSAASPMDRAMGNFASETNPHTAWGVVFQNNTGQTLSGVTVSYTGEKWRATMGADALRFSFLSSSSEITDLLPTEGATPSGWTGNGALDFVVGSDISNGLRDGNEASNRTVLTDDLSFIVPQGSFLALRWFDGDDTGIDAAMGIDDLTVSFQTAAVPEPGQILLGGAVCGMLGITYAYRTLWRRRARRA